MHSLGAGLPVTGVGSRAQTDERRQAITHCEAIGPKARSATVTVRKRMNSYPLGMHPGTKIDDRCQLVDIWFLPDREQRIHLGNQRLEFCFEARQLRGHPCRVDTKTRADSHLDIFKARFAAKRTDKSRIGHIQTLHGEGLPMPCRFQRGRLALRCRTDDFRK